MFRPLSLLANRRARRAERRDARAMAEVREIVAADEHEAPEALEAWVTRLHPSVEKGR
jgi:hypothetical protein